MADDNLPVLWTPDSHTHAKLSILKSYLSAWMPILSRNAANNRGREVLYIDGFAGPGKYADGTKGSPLVAIEAAAEHFHDFPISIRMFFIEKNRERWQYLVEQLQPYHENPPRNLIVEQPVLGEADIEIRRILETRNYQYIPIFVFLDQFGYSAISMDLIRNILSAPSSEVFSFMNWRDLNRYQSDPNKWSAIDRALGESLSPELQQPDWQQIFQIPEGSRPEAFLNQYLSALRERGGATYSCSFAMHDQRDQLLYWLIFCSNSDRGLEVMKKAMGAADKSGTFKFSDRYSNQLRLLPGFDQDWLADALVTRFSHREMTLQEVRDHVLTETPCYQYKTALAQLEKAGSLIIVKAPPGRRKGSFKSEYNDTLVVRFERARQQLDLF